MAISGGINHITLRVQNLQQSHRFYHDLLGLTNVGERPGMHFYSSGHYNHELALVEDAGLAAKRSPSDGLVHIAFNVDNREALGTLNKKLLNADYPVSAGVDHVISYSIYTRDPDGYVIELTTDCKPDQ